MKQTKQTRRALSASILSVVLCAAMLIGTTFAWFTDSVTSGRNQIVAGNLDVELEYATVVDTQAGTLSEWKTVQDATDLFADGLWEPGYAQVVYLRVSNLGSLALKYQLSMNILSETAGVNVDGQTFNLSDELQYGAVLNQSVPFANRDVAIDAVTSPVALSTPYASGEMHLAANAEPQYLALVVYMPKTVGNEANYRGQTAPKIELGVNLVATQDTVESDSFDNQYDTGAAYEKIYIDNGNGTYTENGQLYVLIEHTYIPVTADDSVDGLYTNANGDAYVATEQAVKSTFENGADQITLIQDVSLKNTGSYGNGTPDTYILTPNAVLDLNGHTITVLSNDRFMIAGSGTVIKNGQIKAGPMSGSATGKISYSLAVTANSQDVVIENIVCEGGIEVLGRSTATLRNVTVTATNFYTIYLVGGATATVESGDFTAKSGLQHFYIQDTGSELILKGGTFSGGTPTKTGSGTLTNLIG